MTDPVGPPRLARASYDRAALQRPDSAWIAQAWTRARVIVISPSGSTPVQRGDGVVRLSFREPSTVDSVRRFLGVVDDMPYFTVTVDEDDDGWANLREVGAGTDDMQTNLLTNTVTLEQ